MFERFTDDARRTVVFAQEEVRANRHAAIGTEHLLLGLLHTGDGVAAETLRSLGASAEDVREEVLQIVGPGQKEASDQIPFTPRAKKVLELSLREALQLGHREITDGHILLALLREGGGVAAQALTQLGLELPAVRARVLESMADAGHAQAPARRRFFRRGVMEQPGESAVLGLSGVPVSPAEGLDDHAWDALVKARSTARRRGAHAVCGIDLLAGVAAMGGPAAEALRATGVDPAELEAAVLAVSGPQDAAPPALPFARPLRDALAVAVEEANRSGQAATTTHALLALLMHPDAELISVLDDLDVVLPDLHAEIARGLMDP
jgi:ATP-dependent Clp protease ATP-binding subunit ClpA